MMTSLQTKWGINSATHVVLDNHKVKNFRRCMTSSEPKMLLWIPQMTLPELFMKRPSTKRWEYGLGLFLAYWWNAYLIPVRIDPGILKSTWSWSECVLDVPKFSGPGPSRSWISQIFPVLVRFGPGFLKIFGSGPVRKLIPGAPETNSGAGR